MWYESIVQFHSFACSCLIFPIPIIGQAVFFLIVYSYFLCCRLIDYINVSLFLGSLFCSIDSSVCFCANTTLF